MQPGMIRERMYRVLICTMFILAGIVIIDCKANADDTSSLTLAWDKAATPPEGYRVFQRMEGQAFNYKKWVYQGALPTCKLNNLIAGKTYYFTVRAYTGSAQSKNSKEIKYTTPAKR